MSKRQQQQQEQARLRRLFSLLHYMYSTGASWKIVEPTMIRICLLPKKEKEQGGKQEGSEIYMCAHADAHLAVSSRPIRLSYPLKVVDGEPVGSCYP